MSPTPAPAPALAPALRHLLQAHEREIRARHSLEAARVVQDDEQSVRPFQQALTAANAVLDGALLEFIDTLGEVIADAVASATLDALREQGEPVS